jgi:purine nucleosidase
MPKKFVIDSDGVADDVRAISLALQHDDVEVLAITTVIGCVSALQATANVARTLRANGVAPKKIPIYRGAETPLIGNDHDHEGEKWFFGADGISGRPNDFPPVEAEDFLAHVEGKHAANALVDIFKEHPNEITLVCLGPLTNIAMALKLCPMFSQWPKQVVCMGGNIYGAGNVKSYSTAEFNFSNDPEAAHIVIKEFQCPVTIVPWECFLFPASESKIDFHAHLNLDTPLSKYFNTVTFSGRKKLEESGIQYAYCDEIAMATAIDPDNIILEEKMLRGSVELHGSLTRGQLALDWTEVLWNEEKMTLGKFCNKRRPIRFVVKYNIPFLDEMIHKTVKKCL